VKRLLACSAAVLAASAAGCLEIEDDTIQFSDNFETAIYVSWIWGGDIQMVTTIHPGEHAAMIGPGAWMEHALSIDRIVDEDDPWGQSFSDGNWIEYTSDCVGRPALTIDPFTVPPGADRAARIRLVLDGPIDSTFARRKLMLPALPAFLGPPDEPAWAEEYMIQFRALRIETAPAAVCTIDNLHVMVSGGSLGY
jgi:hypothetical protein